jgi:hypothetical protein
MVIGAQQRIGLFEFKGCLSGTLTKLQIGTLGTERKDMKQYRACVYNRIGFKLYETKPYATRIEAIADAFLTRPNAKSCVTSYGVGMDIRVHKRDEIQDSAKTQ